MDTFGPLPERQDVTASRRAQSPVEGADRTSVPIQHTLPQPAPHHHRHASRCTRYVGVLRTARHSGRNATARCGHTETPSPQAARLCASLP